MPSQFDTLPLSHCLLTVLGELGFDKLTPIQDLAIAPLLQGRDVIGQAQTGSGKTAAFALPMLERLDLTRCAPQAVVLCPTRELSSQVATQVRTLGRRLNGLRVQVLCGGQPVRPQSDSLRRGAHVVVGTPGRVLDHLTRGTLRLEQTSMVVLDEADRMLDMGFSEDMAQILSHTPTTRQTALFSATFPSSIQSLSEGCQRDPLRLRAGDQAHALPNIRTDNYRVSPSGKPTALCNALSQHDAQSALVFCNMKATVKSLASALRERGLSVAAIHGDLDQAERDQVMAQFRNASVRYLIATDVAARGLDVPDLPVVVNYDLPQRADNYVHRIGRTGRAGTTGLAITLFTAEERPRLAALQQVDLDDLQAVEPERPASQQPQGGGAPSDVNRPSAQHPRLSAPADHATLRVGGGRKDKLRPGDLLGALTGESGGLAGSEIGRIEIQDNVTYVAVARSVSRQAARGLTNGRIKGRRFRVSLLD